MEFGFRYSSETLPEGYSDCLVIDLQNDRRTMIIVNVLAIALAVIMAIPLVLGFGSHIETYDWGYFDIMLRVAVAFAATGAYIFLHEAVHGIAMKICGTKKVKFGFAGSYAYAGSDEYYNKSSYIFIALAPVVLWGVVLLALNFLVPADWFWPVYFVQLMNVSGAAGDIYMTGVFLRMPKDILVRDEGTRMHLYAIQR